MRAEAALKRRNIEFGAIPLSVQELRERGEHSGVVCGCGWLSVGVEAMRRWFAGGRAGLGGVG